MIGTWTYSSFLRQIIKIKKSSPLLRVKTFSQVPQKTFHKTHLHFRQCWLRKIFSSVVAKVESTSFIWGWSDAEDLWCWLHFSENRNRRSSSAAGDLKAIWCFLPDSRNHRLIMTLTILLNYRGNIRALFNYNGLTVHSLWFYVQIYPEKLIAWNNVSIYREDQSHLVKKAVTNSVREQQEQYICKNKNVNKTGRHCQCNILYHTILFLY